MASLHLGLAQGLVPEDPAELTAARARKLADLGVTRLVTHFGPDAGLEGDPGRRLRDVLETAGLAIAQYAGAESWLASADPARRRASVEVLGRMLRAASTLGADMVLTGPGSCHPTHSYGPSAENHTAATRANLIAALRELAVRAEDAGVPVALECHVLTVLDSGNNVREMLDAVDSPWILANFDPVNFLGSPRAVYDAAAIARDVARSIGDRLAPAAHVKDVVICPDLVVHIEERPPGTGILDIRAILEVCRDHLPDGATIAVEHFGPEESEQALRHVRACGDGLGLWAKP